MWAASTLHSDARPHRDVNGNVGLPPLCTRRVFEKRAERLTGGLFITEVVVHLGIRDMGCGSCLEKGKP